MADRTNRRTTGGAGQVGRLRPEVRRVLPCIDSTVNSSFFAMIRDAKEIDLLPVALVSTLAFRAQSDQPDAIVIATEGPAATAWWNGASLKDVLSATPTILLTGELNLSLRRRAARSNIRSVLPLDIGANQLVAAIRATIEGLTVTLELHSHTQELNYAMPFANADFAEEPLAEHLTARETEVLRRMALGHGNKEIAAQLAISEHTAKFHVSSVLAKLGATSRTEAVTMGIMRGLVAI